MHFGFSWVGLIFLLMLFTPNLVWTRHQPEGYMEYTKRENKVLLVLERIGEVVVTCLVLLFRDFNPKGWSLRLLWLLAALVCMVLYELFWIRYFNSRKTMEDLYRSYLGIPVAGATLPVAATLLIAIYGKNPFLFAAGIILGIGHIGIHLTHRKELLEHADKKI